MIDNEPKKPPRFQPVNQFWIMNLERTVWYTGHIVKSFGMINGSLKFHSDNDCPFVATISDDRVDWSTFYCDRPKEVHKFTMDKVRMANSRRA